MDTNEGGKVGGEHCGIVNEEANTAGPEPVLNSEPTMTDSEPTMVSKFHHRLSDEERRQMMAALHSRRWSKAVIRDVFGVHRSSITLIKRGEMATYRDIQAELDANPASFLDKWLTGDIVAKLDTEARRRVDKVLDNYERQRELWVELRQTKKSPNIASGARTQNDAA